MGYATIGETFDTYGHLFPSAADNARRFIDERSRGMSASQTPSVTVDASTCL